MLTPANPVLRLKPRELVFLNNCFGILFTNITLFQVCAEVEGAGKAAVQRSKSSVLNSSSNSGMLVQQHSLIVNVINY